MTPRRIRTCAASFAVAAALLLTAGCDTLYRTTATYSIDPATGHTNAVAVTVAPNATVTEALQAVTSAAPMAGPYAPLVTGTAALLATLLGFGTGIYQWTQQRKASAMLNATIDGVEAAGPAAAPVKTTIQHAATLQGVQTALDAAVQART